LNRFVFLLGLRAYVFTYFCLYIQGYENNIGENK